MNFKSTPNEASEPPCQYSHLLFVLSNARIGQETSFVEWHRGSYSNEISQFESVIHIQHYEQHEVDITEGRYPRVPFKFLGLYRLLLDGAEEADALIRRINALFAQQRAAHAPATWLYYPVSEKVGRTPRSAPPMLTLAFANGIPGREGEFREWYATRHLRHALKIPALATGQCFEQTRFQMTGALDALYNTIAIYEQVGSPEDIIRSFASLPLGTFDFPAMDLTRFSEWVYRPLL